MTAPDEQRPPGTESPGVWPSPGAEPPGMWPSLGAESSDAWPSPGTEPPDAWPSPGAEPLPDPHYPAGPYQQPHPYPPYVVVRPTNGMAIASMVLGIVWIYWIGSILALIFGYVARAQIRRSGQGGDGMAVAGIVLGWVGVGVLCAVLVAVVASQ